MSAHFLFNKAQAARAWLNAPLHRRLCYAAAALSFAALSIFPRPYVARVKVMPEDGNGGALGAIIGTLGGGLQNLASTLGRAGNIETLMAVGTSHDVRQIVISNLKLAQRLGHGDASRAEVVLMHKVDVHSLPGGLLAIEVHDHDRQFALQLASAYSDAFRARLSSLDHEQTELKRKFISVKVDEAWQRLRQAEDALITFQTANKLTSPQVQLGAAVAMKTSLQAQLQAKLVELQSAQQFATNDNMRVRAIRADIAALQTQITQTDRQSQGASLAGSPNLPRLTGKEPEYINLYRNFKYYESLYEIYTSFLEETNVEELANHASVETVEPAYIDPQRHFNIAAVGTLLITLLLAFYTEYYIPMTGLGRKPVSPRGLAKPRRPAALADIHPEPAHEAPRREAEPPAPGRARRRAG